MHNCKCGFPEVFHVENVTRTFKYHHVILPCQVLQQLHTKLKQLNVSITAFRNICVLPRINSKPNAGKIGLH